MREYLAIGHHHMGIKHVCTSGSPYQNWHITISDPLMWLLSAGGAFCKAVFELKTTSR